MNDTRITTDIILKQDSLRMALFVTGKLRYRGHIQTSESYRSTGMLGKEMGYEISTFQM